MREQDTTQGKQVGNYVTNNLQRRHDPMYTILTVIYSVRYLEPRVFRL